MSRIANQPIPVPTGVDVQINGLDIVVKGPKGQLQYTILPIVTLERDGDVLKVAANDATKLNRGDTLMPEAMAGTTRALVNNMVRGVSQGFEKRLELLGVGYRAQLQGNALNLTLGFSHPVLYQIPEGIQIECPSVTSVIITGIDKQVVGQVAADIRAYRPVEPYKGKGIRYLGEQVVRKEGKKK